MYTQEQLLHVIRTISRLGWVQSAISLASEGYDLEKLGTEIDDYYFLGYRSITYFAKTLDIPRSTLNDIVYNKVGLEHFDTRRGRGEYPVFNMTEDNYALVEPFMAPPEPPETPVEEKVTWHLP